MNELMSFWAQWLRPSAGLPTVQWSLLLAVAAVTGYLVHRYSGLPKVVCYTLVGTDIDENGQIRNPTRVDWAPGLAFVTPPGYWHAHFNESQSEAFLIPIQDAGLQTYLRALDIRFS